MAPKAAASAPKAPIRGKIAAKGAAPKKRSKALLDKLVAEEPAPWDAGATADWVRVVLFVTL
eukprot:5709310-Amphidinium_carterae.1